MSALRLTALFWLLCWFFAGCSRSCKEDIRINGETMGTTYAVVIAKPQKRLSREDLKIAIDARLERLNDIFSTYRPESSISQFNQATSVDNFVIEPEFALVVSHALAITRLTRGAFNIAVDALIDLWGFDRSGRITKRPNHESVLTALNLADSSKIEARGALIKKADSRMTINLSGIAKGFAVDDIARLLKDMGFNNFMVEIGGEIVVSGLNSSQKPWVIGLHDPQSINLRLMAKIGLTNRALASSGTYANFFTEGSKNYSHIIDPRTGYPIEQNLVGVTVIAPDCMTADALATSIMVMGETESRKLLADLKDIDVMMVRVLRGQVITSFMGNFADLMLH